MIGMILVNMILDRTTILFLASILISGGTVQTLIISELAMGAYVDREVLFAWNVGVSGNFKTQPTLSTTTIVHQY